MNKSVMLKWARKDRRLTQKQVGDAVGLSDKMISKLELDHNAWKGLNESTKVKFNEFFEGSKGWEPIEIGTTETESIENVEESTEEDSEIEKPVAKRESKNREKGNKLTEKDDKTLTLIEFAYEGLIESRSHDDFAANINMLRRILKKYGI